MNELIRNIKYRWQNGQAPLSGELLPLDSPEGKISVVFSCYPGVDEEKIKFFRHFRGLLGYGPGWTLWQAIYDSLMCAFLYSLPVILIATLIALGFFLGHHVK